MAEESRKLPFVPKKPPIKVPPGYRFKPTDEELVVHYLRRRAYNLPLQPNIIEEVELYHYSPDVLTEDPNNERKGLNEWYFFSPRQRKYRNGGRPDRAAGAGYWKATGADKDVMTGGKIVGKKKTLVYYKGRPPKGEKTNWIMHEFVLTDAPARERAGIDDMRLDDWVLCKVYGKCSKNLKSAPENGIDRRLLHAIPDGTPQTETEEQQAAAVAAIAIKEEQQQQKDGNINIPPEQFDQVGVYNNMLPNFYNGASTSAEMGPVYNGYSGEMAPLYNGASTSGETAPVYHGYEVSTSGYSDFSGSLDPIPKHYNTMFPQQAVSGYHSFIPTAAPLSSIAPHPYNPMGQCYPPNMIQDQHRGGNEGFNSDSNLNSSFLPTRQPFPSLPSIMNSSFPLVQESFPSLPGDVEFSDEDSYLLDMDFGIENKNMDFGIENKNT